MKFIKTHFPVLLLFISYFIVAQTANDGFYFDGVDDFINVGDAANTNIRNINSRTTNNRTYETWFKAEEVTSRQFIMKEGAGTRAVIIYIENGYIVAGGYNRADYTPRWEGTFFRKAITAGTWFHVALVLDNALAPNNTTNPMGANQNTALKFYLDGVLIGENSGYQFGGHNTMRLGYKDASVRFPSITATGWTNQLNSEYFFSATALTNFVGTNYFEGYLWGFRVWNRVRTQQEIDAYKADIITTVGTDDLVAVLDGDSFTYLNNDNITTSEATVSPVDTVIWSANAGSTDWNTGANWVGGVVPSALKKETAIIQQSNIAVYPIITPGLHIVTGDLEVQANASVTIQSGGTLEVSYDIDNEGTVNVNESGSLILREKKALIGNGIYNVERNTPTYAGNDFYSYWSSPVVSADSNIATVFSDAELIYAFASSASNSDWAFHGKSNFEQAVGYAVQNEGTGGQLRLFSGKVNSRDIAINVYNTSNLAGTDNDGDAWSTSGDNLIGNPYPAAIDWDLVVSDPDNTELSGEIYFWNQNTSEAGENNVSDYLQYNPTGGSSNTASGKIGTAQGFFVRTASNSKITFKTTHQVVANNNQFFKGTSNKTPKKEGRSWFTFNRGDKTNTLLVGFLKGATNRYDRIYDAPFNINQKSLGFYSIVKGGQKASIQGLPKLRRAKKVVKLGFIVDEIGEYSIGIQEEHINTDYYIYLRDTEKKVTIDLRKRKYTFTIDSLGENTTRFKLVYTKKRRRASNLKANEKESLFVEEIDTKDFAAYVDSTKELIVTYDFDEDNVSEVFLFDIQGRQIKSFKGNQTKEVSSLPKGVYILKAILENSKILSKKIVIME
ncbi:T9SS type A sorting domain-containing protein [uncultured Polaribacter sp.]|uniref:T9SS type A sorting domain-containing protein n=1 Tax=uncultured Polaribacter sp. TaxID=174711 RepID=UPI0026243501|nr:T9SS type A sorting domain-containing protein [uncultured Polaribacter sp.]